MNKFLCLGIFIFLLIPFKSESQHNNPIFYGLRSDYTIISDRTTCVNQDYMGYIWIGTEEGLSRNTGLGPANYKSTHYKSIQNDSTSLVNDYITSIFSDSKNNLWIGTFSGLCKYNFEKDHFERIGNEFSDFIDQSINTVAEKDDKLWFGTDTGIIVYDAVEHKVNKIFEVKDENNNYLKIRKITRDDDQLWIGTSRGLYFIENDNIKKVEIIQDMDISSIAVDKDRLLIGTVNNGLFLFKNQKELEVLNTMDSSKSISNKINDILILRDNSIWVATNSGINVLDKLTREVVGKYQYDFNNWYGISDPEIRRIFQSKEDGIWLTTPLGGVNLFHDADNQFEYFSQRTKKAKDNELLDYAILSMMPDTVTKKLWLGTRKGLSLYNPETRLFDHYPFSDTYEFSLQILSISKSADNKLWLGTEKGLYQWCFDHKSFIEPTRYKVKDQVNIVFTDSDKNTWVGTKESGLFRIDVDSEMLNEIKLPNSESSQNLNFKAINDILQLPDGTIWVGTANGLFYLKNGVLSQYSSSQKQNDISWVNDLTISPEGDLLVSTKQQGLILIDENLHATNFINKESGLLSNSISSVVIDSERGDWWLSGDKGLSKVSIKKDSISSIVNFDVLDGLQGAQFTPRAGAAISDYVFFGGLSGLTMFNPAKIMLEIYPLNLSFFKLYIGGKEVKPGDHTNVLTHTLSVTNSIRLQPEYENFSIEFHGIDYIRPDSLIYQYKLENYDQKWIETSSNIVSFTSLERGKNYVFKVRAKSRLREWSATKQLQIFLIPYFYETFWFKILFAFIGLILVAIVVYIREFRIKKNQSKLEHLISIRTSELQRQIIEKEKTAKELEVVAEEAKKADKAKSEFLAKISHEMRTPLNGIMGLSQMAKEQDNEQEKNELLDLVYRSSESLKGIINDLLDFGKLEFEKLEIYDEELNIYKLIKELVSFFQPQINEKSISLDYEIDSEIPENLLGDLLRIRQVLVNLMANAIKFTDAGAVKIILKQILSDHHSSTIKFTVEDTGIGIPESKTALIFSSFEQIDNGLTRKYEGTGLGLAISQRLVQLMGGTISVQSVERKGTKFEFELKFRKGTKHKEVPVKSVVVLPQGKNILLVEDNPTNILVATKMLKKAGQNVYAVNNGKEALDKLEKNNYDLILMDIQMPIMDGFEATQIIRKTNASYSNIPIIALTAGVMKEDIQKCLDNGMNDFLSKPVDFKTLEVMLLKYLN